MKRKVISIDEEKCIGCGLCSSICHEGVIEIIDGKAKVIKENHCDGLGNCLPNCPVDALELIEKEVELSCNDLNIVRWPIQLKLVSDREGVFEKDELLIAADCTAFTYENFHTDYSKNEQLVIACPKLDGYDYSEKIRNIIINNKIKKIKLLRMEVPCCGGLNIMLKKAIGELNVITEEIIVGINGKLK